MVERDGPTNGSRDSLRRDYAPTINEVDPPGFVIDGTDSFAVPGPADGATRPVDDGSAISRSRVLLTVGSVVAGLVFVVAVGSGGDAGTAGGSRVRSDEPSLLDVDWWDGDGGRRLGAATIGPIDSDTLARLAEADAADGIDSSTDERTLGDATRPTYDFGDDDELADDDYDDDELADGGYTPPRYTPPRRSQTPPRYTPPRRSPITTTPYRPPTVTTSTTTTTSSTTTTTVPAETTTTSSSTTSTTTSSTTTTTQPPRAWAPVTMPAACADVQLLVGDRSLFARTGGALHRSADGLGTWATVTLPADTAELRAIAEPTSGGHWLATEDGVFDAAGAPVGSLADVRSLTALPGGTTLLAVAGEPATIQRWSEGTWTDVSDDLPEGAVPVAVRFLSNGDAILGTINGVFRSIDGGLNWVPATGTHGRSLAGEPAVGPGGVSWVVAGDGGVITSTDGGANWSAPEGAGRGITAVARIPGGAVAVSGGALVTLAGTAFEPAPESPFVPVGVVYSAATKAAFVFGEECLVQRLADPGS